jgi:hypothetical protein
MAAVVDNFPVVRDNPRLAWRRVKNVATDAFDAL